MTERVKIAVSAVLFVIGLACLTFFGVGCSKGTTAEWNSINSRAAGIRAAV